MSGKTWEEIKAEDAVKMQEKFQRLNPEEASFIVWSLLLLKGEPMTRRGHGALDDVLKILGIDQ